MWRADINAEWAEATAKESRLSAARAHFATADVRLRPGQPAIAGTIGAFGKIESWSTCRYVEIRPVP